VKREIDNELLAIRANRSVRGFLTSKLGELGGRRRRIEVKPLTMDETVTLILGVQFGSSEVLGVSLT